MFKKHDYVTCMHFARAGVPFPMYFQRPTQVVMICNMHPQKVMIGNLDVTEEKPPYPTLEVGIPIIITFAEDGYFYLALTEICEAL